MGIEIYKHIIVSSAGLSLRIAAEGSSSRAGTQSGSAADLIPVSSGPRPSGVAV